MFKVIDKDGKQVFCESTMKLAFGRANASKNNRGWCLLDANGNKVIKF